MFRSTTGADLDRVLACTITEPISWIPADRYRAELADRQYRPEWTWIAEDSGQILARALWWGLPGSAHPLALDCVYVHDSVSDRIGLAAAKGGPPDHRHHRHDLNLPMAAAVNRAGYRNYEVRLILSAPADRSG